MARLHWMGFCRIVNAATFFRMTWMIGLAFAAGGCAQFPGVVEGGFDRGYILMLPGVANRPGSMSNLAWGLRDAGIDQAIEQDLWGERPFGEWKNVSSLALNRQRAAERAIHLAGYRSIHPHQPITLIGYSGGGGMALFTCEALPKDVMIDRVILLAAAVSPDYDLAPAMSHCTEGIVNFFSVADWFDAGMLTETFGTMDRKYTSTAGRWGFLDGEGRLSTVDHLTQVAWIPDWTHMGHSGGHPGWDSRVWAREVLARYVPDPSRGTTTAPASAPMGP